MPSTIFLANLVCRARPARQALSVSCHLVSPTRPSSGLPKGSRSRQTLGIQRKFMCHLCNASVQTAWASLFVGQQYRTPDLRAGANFTIARVTPTAIEITPQSITVTRAAFQAAVHYLRSHKHAAANACPIGSSNSPLLSSPLCSAARHANASIRCINYVLPILAASHIVGIGGNRPNTTWLV